MINLKLAFRALARAPFVTVVAVASLALGIGANAAIFSLFNEILLRPLPVPEPAQLVNLAAPGPKPGSQSCNQAGDCETVFSYPMFRDLERDQTVFTGVAAHRSFSANLSFKGRTQSGDGMMVSGSYFPVLGLNAAAGRLIGRGDDKTVGQSPVVVLSHAYWRTRFDSDPAVIDQPLVVNGQALTIVGVAPEGFDGTTTGTKPQVFVPITLRAQMNPGFKGFENRQSYWAYLFARLKPGVSAETAATAINGPYASIVNDVEAPLQKGMTEQTMKRFKAKRIAVEDGRRGQSSVHREARKPLVILLGVTGFVLLIACANIANLLLARAAGRAGEIAIRLSIGAARRHIVGQLLMEAGLMAVLGGALGLLVARWTLAGIASIMPGEAAASLRFEIDAMVFLFAAALSLGTGLLFGLFPALHATRPDLASILKGQSGQPGGSRASSRFRTSLATVQIALSMALLVAAGLFTKSLVQVARVDLGLQVENVVTFSISPELNAYTPERSRALFERLEDELAAVPGVTHVSAAMVPLLAGSNWGNNVSVEGYDPGPERNANAQFNEVGPGYFRTVGIPLISGREFARSDATGRGKVAVVNEEFARRFNLGRAAVGKRMGMGDGKLDIEIVGLVKNAKYSEVKDKVPPLFFLPYRQDPTIGDLTFYVKTASDPAQLLAAIPKVVARLDPNLPVDRLRTLEQQARENVFLDRLIGVLSTSFALLATLLAAIGLYGVLAYTVAQRTREIGLRVALGAGPARVRGMVMRQVGWMTLVGGAIGLLAALYLAKAAESLLFELKGRDPAIFAAAAVTLTLVALLAGYIPARRAARVDPMTALRVE